MSSVIDVDEFEFQFVFCEFSVLYLFNKKLFLTLVMELFPRTPSDATILASFSLLTAGLGAACLLSDRFAHQEPLSSEESDSSRCRFELEFPEGESDFWRQHYPYLPLHQFIRNLGAIRTLDPWLASTEKGNFLFAAVDARDGNIHFAVNGVVLNNPDFENSVGFVTWDEPELLEQRALRVSYPWFYPGKDSVELSYAHVPPLCY